MNALGGSPAALLVPWNEMGVRHEEGERNEKNEGLIKRGANFLNKVALLLARACVMCGLGPAETWQHTQKSTGL